MSEQPEEDREKYIRRLELTLKKMKIRQRELEEENAFLRKKCSTHHTDMQRLLRYELQFQQQNATVTNE